MILDTGICTIFDRVDASTPGSMQKYEYRVRRQTWYGMLNFETQPRVQDEKRENVEIAARIRIPQCYGVNSHNVVVLRPVSAMPQSGPRYNVIRAYQGDDDDNGLPITDLTLAEVEE